MTVNLHLGQIGPIGVNFLVETRDMWIGVFRKQSYIEMGQLRTPLYVFPIPCVGLLLTIDRRFRRGGDDQ